MLRLKGFLTLIVACSTFASQKAAPTGQMENKHAAIRASVYTNKEDIKGLVGSDLGGFYVVVQVQLTPKEKLKVFRDDFMLRTDRDGEKSKPYAASEIAGKGALVVSQVYGGGEVMNNPRPGGGVWGPPVFLPADGQGLGNAAGEVSNQTTVDHGAAKKDNPLQATLDAKILPEKETDQPISGLLYFPMDPKQKAKQLEFYFTSPSGRISMRFK